LNLEFKNDGLPQQFQVKIVQKVDLGPQKVDLGPHKATLESKLPKHTDNNPILLIRTKMWFKEIRYVNQKFLRAKNRHELYIVELPKLPYYRIIEKETETKKSDQDSGTENSEGNNSSTSEEVEPEESDVTQNPSVIEKPSRGTEVLHLKGNDIIAKPTEENKVLHLESKPFAKRGVLYAPSDVSSSDTSGTCTQTSASSSDENANQIRRRLKHLLVDCIRVNVNEK
jgi:hypothetical protein